MAIHGTPFDGRDGVSVSRSRGHEIDDWLRTVRDGGRGFPHPHHAERPLSLSFSPSSSLVRAGRTSGRTQALRTLEEKHLHDGENLSESERESHDPTQRGGLDRAERRDERVCPHRGPPPLGARAQGRTLHVVPEAGSQSATRVAPT